MNKRRQHIILIALFVLLSVGTAVGLRVWLHPPFHLQAVQLLSKPIPMQGQNYGLTFIGDTPIYFDRLMGSWVVLYFGSIACAECQPDLQALGQMLKRFDGAESQDKPKVFFVSFDPEHDSVDKLNTYTPSFHTEMTGLTGRNDELAKFTRFFNIANNEYSSRIFILDPQLRYIGSFAAPHDGDVLYADMQQLIHQLWRYHLKEEHSHAVIPAP